jgi:hypothetical protein
MAKEELVPQDPNTAIERPDWMEKTSGSSDITSEDIRLPRLAIAQGLSPQMIPDKSEFIDGLRMFDMFNDVTGEIYGRGPLRFVPVYWHVKNIEFEKDDKGKNTGIIVDDNVQSGDPRTKWSKDGDVKRPPQATRYTEMVVFLLRPDLAPETIIISIKETNRYMRRAAQIISGALVEVPRPYYGGVYSVKTTPEKFDEGTAGVFVFGIRPTLWNTDRALYERGKELQESLKGKTIVVNRDVAGDEEGDTNFDTSAM